MIERLLKSTLLFLGLFIATTAFASPKDPDQLGDTTKMILAGAAYFICQLCSNAWVTWRNRESDKKLGKIAASANQVDDAKKELKQTFEAAMKELEIRITKQIDDIRLQQKSMSTSLQDEAARFREGLNALRMWIKVNRPFSEDGTTVVPEPKKKA